jgi:DNA (cytosine-5)-methyltransferase 1
LALFVDNDDFARDTYLYNFPTAPYVRADVRRLSPDRIEALAGGRVHILLGCPPCQGFSDGGARDPGDPRNSHLLRFADLAVALKPLAIAMENVPLGAGAPQFRTFTRRLERAGYAWTAGIINAALRGSTQCRQRLVYIGIHRDVGVAPRIARASHGGERRYFCYRDQAMKRLDGDRVSMLGEAPATQRLRKGLPFDDEGLGRRTIPYVGEILTGLPPIGMAEAERLSHRPWAHTRGQLRRMSRVPEGGRWRGGLDHYSQSYGRLHRLGLARTITCYFANPGSGRFWHPTENRALTLREAARIQGFPDSFLFLAPFSWAADLVGNALDSAIATAIYDTLLALLE